jgi:GWxTD domain-containing protein
MAATPSAARARLGIIVALLCLSVIPAQARLKSYPPEDLTNFQLSPDFAQWLVGPLAHVATAEERAGYLALRDDAAAAAFIGAFWERRGPNLQFPPSGPLITFERRAKEADRVFSEGTYLGRRTDRGTVFILYGSPETVEYASSQTGMGPPIEIWNYTKKTGPGLDGERPDPSYGFRLQGPVTKFHSLAGVKKLRRVPRPGGARD